MPLPYRVVLTGGPCAGKSKALEALKRTFGDAVLVVPEASTILIEGGIPRPGHGVGGWSQEWQDDFEHATLALHRALDNMGERAAREQGAQVIVYDRSCLDGAAFVSGTVEEFCAQYGLSYGNELARFDMIIHLQSLAAWDPAQYMVYVGEKRLEDEAATANLREQKLLTVWGKHKRHVVVKGSPNITEKIEAVTKLVAEFVNGKTLFA